MKMNNDKIARLVHELLNEIGMMTRGVEKQNSTLVTSSASGEFRKSLATRREFFSRIGRRA